MKKLLILAVVAIMGLSASAQFANSGSGSTTVSDNNGWSTVYAEWNPMTYYYTGKGDYDDTNFNAVSLGFSRAFALSQSTPIFLEAGLAAQYGFHSDSDGDDNYEATIKYQVLSLKVPVNFLYKWSIPNSSVELMPFLGLTMRGNLWGEEKYETSGKYADDDEETANLFEKRYGQ